MVGCIDYRSRMRSGYVFNYGVNIVLLFDGVLRGFRHDCVICSRDGVHVVRCLPHENGDESDK